MSINILRPATFPKPFQSFPHIGKQWPVYNVESPQAVGLVTWLPLIGEANSSLYLDYISYSKLASTGSITWINDINRGWSLNFDGSTAEIDDAWKTRTLPLTLSCWIKPTATTSLQAFFGLYGSGSNYYSLQYWYGVGKQILARHRSNSGDKWANSVIAIVHNEWSFICGVFASDSSRKVYINGKQAGNENTSSVSGTVISKINIGKTGSESFYGGQLSDPRVYNRALTSTEVYQLYDPFTRWELYTPPKRLFFVPAAAASFPWPSPKSHPNRNVLLRL